MPICNICNKGGHGVQFPMTPKTQGHKFGTICAECDEGQSLRIERRVFDEVGEDNYDEAMEAVYQLIDEGSAF